MLEVCTRALPRPVGTGTSRREGERGRADSGWRDAVLYGGIGAVGLWVVWGWNWCGEPSQALRASSPGGRAKSLVGVDGWRESQGCGGHRKRRKQTVPVSGFYLSGSNYFTYTVKTGLLRDDNSPVGGYWVNWGLPSVLREGGRKGWELPAVLRGGTWVGVTCGSPWGGRGFLGGDHFTRTMQMYSSPL